MAVPKVLVGIPCLMNGGFRPFEVALAQLQSRQPGISIFYSMGGVLPGARNRIVREAIRQEAEYVWFLDDDQPFFPGGDDGKPSDLDSLLAHNVDAVIPLSCRRGAPFLPLLYDVVHEDGWIATQHYLLDHDRGLIPVAAAGLAGLLIKVSVLKRMSDNAWFEFTHPPDNCDDYNEDLNFYVKLQKLGIQLYCDLEVRFGHAVTSVAYLIRQHGQWVVALADHEPFVMFPCAKHPLGIDHVRQSRQNLVLAH